MLRAVATPFICQVSELQRTLDPTNLDTLNGEFPDIPANQQYQVIGRAKKEIVWNRVQALSALVLGLLTAYAYQQAQKNLAIALGVLAGVQLYNISSSKETPGERRPTPQFAEQLQKIHNLFVGVAEQFTKMHEFASNTIVSKVNNEEIRNLDGAKRQIQEWFGAYREGNHPFDKLEKVPEAYQAQMAACFVGAQHIADLGEDFINQIRSEPLKKEIRLIQPIAQRLVYGKVPEGGENPGEIIYVRLKQAQDNEPITAKAWKNAAQRA